MVIYDKCEIALIFDSFSRQPASAAAAAVAAVAAFASLTAVA